MMEEDEAEFEDESSVVQSSSIPIQFLKKGILLKKGRNKIFRPWVLRTVVLESANRLLYFDGSKLRGEVHLDGTTINPVPKEQADGKPHAFEISNIATAKRTQLGSLLLAASSVQEASEWINALQRAINSCSQQKSRTISGYVTLQVL